MRPRLYFAAAKLAWQDALEYRLNSLVFFAITGLGVLTAYFLWGEIFADRAVLLGYTRNEMVTYYIMVGYVITTAFAWTPMAEDIRTGRLSAALARPASYLWLIYVETLGRRLFRLLIGLPVVVVLFAIFSDGVFVPTDPRGYLALAVAVIGAVNIMFLIDCLVMVFEFWVLYSESMFWLVELIIFLLAGSMIPLVFLPDWIQTIASYLPFKYIGNFPVDAFMGRLPWNEVLSGLAMQVVWALLLVGLLLLIWRRGIKRFESFGG